MNTNFIIGIVAALMVGAFIAIMVLAIGRGAKKNTQRDIRREQLESILSGAEEGEFLEEEEEEFSIFNKWFRVWGRLFQELSGSFNQNDTKAGYLVIGLYVAIAAGVGFFVNNPLAGMVIAAVAVFILFIFLRIRAGRKDAVIRVQLTGFLFALKAHLTANETPERAVMRVIDDMPKPLWDELLPLKNQILSNVSFEEALKELRSTTTSNDLRFLCSCIIQSVSAGTSLEKQIDKIREVVDTRKRITEEISQATKSASNAIYIASVIFPGLFIGVYMLDEQAREYWFVDPMSWAMLAVAGMLFGFGVYLARKFVNAVKKL